MASIRSALVLARQGNLLAAIDNEVRARSGRPRRLMSKPVTRTYRHSSRRLGAMVEICRGTRYLEIGLADGSTFESVPAPMRVGVDPVPAFDVARLPQGVEVFVGTSDDYFSHTHAGLEFDVAFIDGLHHFEQTYVDIVNAFRHLSRSGMLLVDDVVPSDRFSALRDPDEARRLRAEAQLSGTPWHGDVFLSLLVLRDHHPDIQSRVILGSGNPQAVLWCAGGLPRSTSPISRRELEAYGSVSYDQVFGDGVPEWMRPGREQDVLAEAERALRSPNE